MRIRYVLPLAVVLGLGIASLAVASTRDHHKSSQTQFTALLQGHNETPAVHTNGMGKLTLTINSDNTMSYTLTYSGLNNPATVAHVHIGQPNVSGGVVFYFCGGGTKAGTPCPAGNTTTPVSVSGPVTAADIVPQLSQGIAAGDVGLAAVVQEIRAGFAYANIHTAVSPGGEIRGQLGSHGHDQGDDDEDDD
jgi:hypothetical protein